MDGQELNIMEIQFMWMEEVYFILKEIWKIDFNVFIKFINIYYNFNVWYIE